MRCLTKCVETQNWKRFDLVLSTVNSLLSEHKSFASSLERIDGVEILLSILLCIKNKNDDDEKRIVNLLLCLEKLNPTDTELRMLEHMISKHAQNDAVMKMFTKMMPLNYFRCEMWTKVASNLAVTNLLHNVEGQKDDSIKSSITMRWLLCLVQFRDAPMSETLAQSALRLFVRLTDESLLSSIAGFVVKSLSSERIRSKDDFTIVFTHGVIEHLVELSGGLSENQKEFGKIFVPSWFETTAALARDIGNVHLSMSLITLLGTLIQRGAYSAETRRALRQIVRQVEPAIDKIELFSHSFRVLVSLLRGVDIQIMTMCEEDDSYLKETQSPCHEAAFFLVRLVLQSSSHCIDHDLENASTLFWEPVNTLCRYQDRLARDGSAILPHLARIVSNTKRCDSKQSFAPLLSTVLSRVLSTTTLRTREHLMRMMCVITDREMMYGVLNQCENSSTLCVAVADSWSRGFVRDENTSELIRACKIVTKMTLLSKEEDEEEDEEESMNIENDLLLSSCRGLLLHALKVPKLFENVLSILSHNMDVLVPEEEVLVEKKKEEKRRSRSWSLEQRGTTSPRKRTQQEDGGPVSSTFFARHVCTHLLINIEKDQRCVPILRWFTQKRKVVPLLNDESSENDWFDLRTKSEFLKWRGTRFESRVAQYDASLLLPWPSSSRVPKEESGEEDNIFVESDCNTLRQCVENFTILCRDVRAWSQGSDWTAKSSIQDLLYRLRWTPHASSMWCRDDDSQLCRRWRLSDIEISSDYVSSSTIRLGARRILRPYRGLELESKKKSKGLTAYEGEEVKKEKEPSTIWEWKKRYDIITSETQDKIETFPVKEKMPCIGWTFRAANAIAQHVNIAHLLGGSPPRWTLDEKCMNSPRCQIWCDVQVDGVNVPGVCLMFDNALIFLKAVVSLDDEDDQEEDYYVEESRVQKTMRLFGFRQQRPIQAHKLKRRVIAIQPACLLMAMPMRSILHVANRRYLLQDISAEIFAERQSCTGQLLDSNSIFVTLDSITARDSFTKLIMRNLKKRKSHKMMTPTRKRLTNAYLRGEISNFDYLLQLNFVAGRSYRDLSQYPVFPWITSSYEKNDKNVQLRDLSKPMGSLREERRKLVVARYQSLAHEGGLGGSVSAFHYGTHYSCSAYVANYLVRLYPYANIVRDLQGGGFEKSPDRLFWGLGDAYASASGGTIGKGFNTHDVRELIPEMFCADCFLANPNRFVFGKRQGGEIVDEVLLPLDPRRFVARHRRLLDKSERINEWIDLIFGCDQRSIKKTNVFHPYSYSTEFDKAVAAAAAAKHAKKSKTDNKKKVKKRRLTTRSEAMRSHVREYGVTPRKLFETKAHPKRVTMYQTVITPLSALTEQNVSFEVLSLRLNANTSAIAQRSMPKPLMGVYIARGSPVRRVSTIVPCKRVACGCRLEEGSQPVACAIENNDTIVLLSTKSAGGGKDMDGILVEHLERVVGRISIPRVSAVILTKCARNLVAGTNDGCVIMWSLSSGGVDVRMTRRCIGHADNVKGVRASCTYASAITFSSTSLIHWDLVRGEYLRTLLTSDEEEQILDASINERSGDIVTLTSLRVYLWDTNGALIGSATLSSPAKCICSSECSYFDTDRAVLFVLGNVNGTITLWTENEEGNLIVSRVLKGESSKPVMLLHPMRIGSDMRTCQGLLSCDVEGRLMLWR